MVACEFACVYVCLCVWGVYACMYVRVCDVCGGVDVCMCMYVCTCARHTQPDQPSPHFISPRVAQSPHTLAWRRSDSHWANGRRIAMKAKGKCSVLLGMCSVTAR